MKIKYVKEIGNSNHPEILYWFWTPDMIKNKTYIQELEQICKTMPFDLLFLTSRDGLSFFDYDDVVVPFKETVERAHELGVKIGLQLWRNAEAVGMDDALALIVEGEALLDDDGMLEYEAHTRGHRNQESLKSELFSVVLFEKVGAGFYAEDSLMDITQQCQVLYSDEERIKIKIDEGVKYARYTAYILTAHYHRSPDLFSQFSINSFNDAINRYAEIPFDGIGLDEFKSMPITPPFQAMWKPFRERLYGKAFAERFYDKTGMDLKQAIFEMRYVPENHKGMRIKAINYYFDVLKEGPIMVENFVYEYAKKVYGKDIFIGLHNTYHNKLTNDEIWETGCMWWDLPREYGQTDENMSYPVRMGIACSHPKPIVYDMYYTEGRPYPIYEKAMIDARYNNRIHYHAYNDRRENRFNMKNEQFSKTITKIEQKIRLLNGFNGPLPKLDLLVVFGRPALANWYPHNEYRNAYDINGGLFILEKCQALWDAGVMCGLVPSDKIEKGQLRINSEKQIEYNGHVFDSILFLNPEYAKQSTLDFLEDCTHTDSTVMIDGKANYDFEGKSCSRQFSRIAQKAELIEFSVDKVLSKGIKTNPIKQGCMLEDGSVVMTDLTSILTNKPLTFKIKINHHVYEGRYIGVMAIKVDEKGNIVKFVCGGFKELHRDRQVIISVSKNTDIMINAFDKEANIILKGEENHVSIELLKLSFD
ncbi:hypothetical protein HZI73_20955 [Vallitalea pronyensis]|uniref:Uncharacterized protein n=1 Tax=Vallitalea pronyensis TaxID=1348613 RepID=A0A8J8MNU2_9FIRM|nr:hypothetical protein [Vallitalea pronyensis]QUI24623.1 hypothetical protein HZI73_20955 [Vallitalea pronyensis]